MIYSIPYYVDDLFDESSLINKSIQQLENVIHKQIYNSTESILNSKMVIQENEAKYSGKVNNIKKVSQIRDMIWEKKPYDSLHSCSQPKAFKNLDQTSKLLLSNTGLNSTQSDVNYHLSSRIVYGDQITQDLTVRYTAFGLLSLKSLQIDTQQIVAAAIKYKLNIEGGKSNLVKFAIESIYKHGKYCFNFIPRGDCPLDSCVLIDRGSKKVADSIKNKFKNKHVDNQDQLHEIDSCAEVLKEIGYSGNAICFIGNIKVNECNGIKMVDELDGFIYLPNACRKHPFAFIVEAKNKNHGESEAANQLEKTKGFLSEEISTKIFRSKKYAYMSISHNQ